MAGAKNHEYHILSPSIWPLVGSFSALVMAAGGVRWLHSMAYGGEIFFLGVAGVLGNPRVNVLALNLALEELAPAGSDAP